MVHEPRQACFHQALGYRRLLAAENYRAAAVVATTTEVAILNESGPMTRTISWPARRRAAADCDRRSLVRSYVTGRVQILALTWEDDGRDKPGLWLHAALRPGSEPSVGDRLCSTPWASLDLSGYVFAV